MKLTKEEAKQLLFDSILIHGMPEYDAVVYSNRTDKEDIEYTFRYLLSYVYDLNERL